MKTLPELMSPAGNFEAFLAALKNGANAIYLGLQEFNARRPAKNFTNQEFLQAIDLAHKKKCQIYLTLNIELKESELIKAINLLHFVNKSGVDAIIVRDFAILQLIKLFEENEKFTPEIHFSTQGGACNYYDLIMLKELGASRVVLARELNYTELKSLSSKDNIPELEIFIHGSMCFSFSGKCSFSSWLGGKSANRGACMAPCRFKYTALNSDNTKQKQGSFFNMKDLNLVNEIEKLKKLNIKAYKIEGRLKNYEWVGEVTKHYQKLLGSTQEENSKLTTEINNSLQIYSGREYSTGFFLGTDNLTGSNNVKFGLYLGNVISKTDVGFLTNIKKEKITFPITIRVYKDKFIKLLSYDNEEEVVYHNSYLILPLDSDLELDTELYQVFKHKQQKKESIENGKYNLSVIYENGNITFYINSNIGSSNFTVKAKIIKKQNRALNILQLEEELIGVFFKGLVVGKCNLPDLLIARSQLKHLVKEISNHLIVLINNSKIPEYKQGTKLLNNYFTTNPIKQTNSLLLSYENISSLRISAWQFTSIPKNQLKELKENGIVNLEICDLQQFDTNQRKISEQILVASHFNLSVYFDIDGILLDSDLEQWKTKFSMILNHSNEIYSKFKGFIINSVGHLSFLKENKWNNKRVKGGEGLRVLNSLAANYLANLGISNLTISLESDLKNIIKITQNNTQNYRLVAFSRIPVFISRVQNNFEDGQIFVDNQKNKIIYKQKGEWSYYYSLEHFSAFMEETADLKFNEIIADFTTDDGEIIDLLIKLKKNPVYFPVKHFNLKRKLL